MKRVKTLIIIQKKMNLYKNKIKLKMKIINLHIKNNYLLIKKELINKKLHPQYKIQMKISSQVK